MWQIKSSQEEPSSEFIPTMAHCPLFDNFLSYEVMGTITRHCRMPYRMPCLPLQSSSYIPLSSSQWLIGVRLLTTTQEATHPSSPDTCQGHTTPDHITSDPMVTTGCPPQHHSQRYLSRCILAAATPPRGHTTTLTWPHYQEIPGHTKQLHHRISHHADNMVTSSSPAPDGIVGKDILRPQAAHQTPPTQHGTRRSKPQIPPDISVLHRPCTDDRPHLDTKKRLSHYHQTQEISPRYGIPSEEITTRISR